MVSKLHPLAGQTTVTFDQLKEETFISLEDLNPSSHKFILDMCRLAEYEPKKILKTDYFTRIKYLEENKGVVLTSIQAIAWKKGSYISRTGRLLIEFVAEYCRQNSFSDQTFVK